MPTVKNRQLPLAIPTNLILAFTWEKGIKKMDAADEYGDGEETGEKRRTEL